MFQAGIFWCSTPCDSSFRTFIELKKLHQVIAMTSSKGPVTHEVCRMQRWCWKIFVRPWEWRATRYFILTCVQIMWYMYISIEIYKMQMLCIYIKMYLILSTSFPMSHNCRLLTVENSINKLHSTGFILKGLGFVIAFSSHLGLGFLKQILNGSNFEGMRILGNPKGAWKEWEKERKSSEKCAMEQVATENNWISLDEESVWTYLRANPTWGAWKLAVLIYQLFTCRLLSTRMSALSWVTAAVVGCCGSSMVTAEGIHPGAPMAWLRDSSTMAKRKMGVASWSHAKLCGLYLLEAKFCGPPQKTTWET